MMGSSGVLDKYVSVLDEKEEYVGQDGKAKLVNSSADRDVELVVCGMFLLLALQEPFPRHHNLCLLSFLLHLLCIICLVFVTLILVNFPNT